MNFMPEPDSPPSKSELRRREKMRKRDQRYGHSGPRTPPGAFEKRLTSIGAAICTLIGLALAVIIFTAIGGFTFGGMGAFIGFLIGIASAIGAWNDLKLVS